MKFNSFIVHSSGEARLIRFAEKPLAPNVSEKKDSVRSKREKEEVKDNVRKKLRTIRESFPSGAQEEGQDKKIPSKEKAVAALPKLAPSRAPTKPLKIPRAIPVPESTKHSVILKKTPPTPVTPSKIPRAIPVPELKKPTVTSPKIPRAIPVSLAEQRRLGIIPPKKNPTTAPPRAIPVPEPKKPTVIPRKAPPPTPISPPKTPKDLPVKSPKESASTTAEKKREKVSDQEKASTSFYEKLPYSDTSFAFDRNLQNGSTGSQVTELQKFLNQNGYPVADSGAGSAGEETEYFGPLTSTALAKFQEANDKKAPGLLSEKGTFGPATRQYVNSLQTAGEGSKSWERWDENQSLEELVNAGLSEHEILVRMGMLQNVAHGKTYFPGGKLPEIRNSNCWRENSEGNFVPKVRPTEAIRDLWRTRNGIQCYQYSSLIMLKTLIDLADENQLRELDRLLENKAIPGDLSASERDTLFADVPPPKNGTYYDESDLLPGDQIWFDNPYYAEGMDLLINQARNDAVKANKTPDEVAKAMERAEEKTKGEQGSNVFYVGNGKVIGIYTRRVMSMDQYRSGMLAWESVKAVRHQPDSTVALSAFKVRGLRRIAFSPLDFPSADDIAGRNSLPVETGASPSI